ncbi:NAD(P)-dependent oxidoreductase [Candidatus Shapirobacteria bacterium]|nr:NAD(P)-dependent oxidoreductase [Candidatus Shapirobacteria bacterium]
MTEVITTGLSGLVGSRLLEIFPDYRLQDLSLDSGHDVLKPNTLVDTFSRSPAKTVLHFAAFTDTNAAWEQRGDKNGLCYQLNVIGTKNIADLCRQYHKHLIHISTDYVFDGSKTTSYTETDTLNPLDWYAQTKYDAEKVVSPEFTVIRIASPYRAIFNAKIDLVRKIIGKLKNNEVCKLFADQYTTPTFIDDIAIGLGKVINNPLLGIYHLVGSSSQSVYDMGQQIANIFGFDQKLIQPSSLADYLKTDNARPYAPNLSLSNQKFIDNYSFTPKTLSEGLAEMKKQLT